MSKTGLRQNRQSGGTHHKIARIHAVLRKNNVDMTGLSGGKIFRIFCQLTGRSHG